MSSPAIIQTSRATRSRRRAESEALARRILDAVPAGQYAMTTLVKLLRIEASDEIPTAAVTCGARPVLKVNPEFVRRFCRTDEHLFMLIMHELHHVLLAHTRQFEKDGSMARNVAFDAVINAFLAMRFPQRAYTSFFTRIYGKSTNALRLLAPPGEVKPDDPELEALHRLLYEDQSVTSEEVYRRLVRELEGKTLVLVPGCGDDEAGKPGPGGMPGGLLGSHGGPDGDWGTAGPVPPEVIEAIRKVVEEWPPAAEPSGRSLGSFLQERKVRPVPPVGAVMRALRHMLVQTAWSRGGRKKAARGSVRVSHPLPSLRDRRGVLSLSMGRRPLLWDAEVPGRRRQPDLRTHVYLDVSSSMGGYIHLLYGALSKLRDLIAPEIYMFSTEVVAAPLTALQDGDVTTTGGTWIDCVLEDAVGRSARRVLVITDGYVGKGSPKLWQEVAERGIDMRVLLTPGGWREDLVGQVPCMAEMPVIEHGAESRKGGFS